MERVEEKTPIQIELSPADSMQKRLSTPISEDIYLPKDQIRTSSFGVCELQADIQYRGNIPIDPHSEAGVIKYWIERIKNNGKSKVSSYELARPFAQDYFENHPDAVVLNPYRDGEYQPVQVNYRGLLAQFDVLTQTPEGKVTLTQFRPIHDYLYQCLTSTSNKLPKYKAYAEKALMMDTYLFECAFSSGEADFDIMPAISDAEVLYIRYDTLNIRGVASGSHHIPIKWNQERRSAAAKLITDWDDIRDGSRLPKKEVDEKICESFCVYTDFCINDGKKLHKKTHNGNGARQTDFFTNLNKFRLEGSETGKCSDCDHFVNITNQLHPDQSGLKLGLVRITQSFDCGCSHTLEVFEEQLTD